ncbi:MAG: EamA family transporter RarD [Pseudomonadota bacterium]
MHSAEPISREGLSAAVAAYLLWGLMPAYFFVMKSVPALEMLAHRIFWAVPVGLLIVLVRRQWGEFRALLTQPKNLGWLTLSATCIAVNWLVYIWAVQREQVFQASLGYYINPLLYVVIGVLFLGERLRRPQLIAIILAAIGVAVLTVSGGQVPWLATGLAISFTIYGVIRSQVAVGAMPGLLVETLVLLPAALLWLGWLAGQDELFFAHAGPGITVGLVAAGAITVLPLLAFAVAARRLPLSTIGVLQFMAPTLQFLLGVAFGEPLTPAHVICFVLIWVGVALFAWDTWRAQRSQVPQKVT